MASSSVTWIENNVISFFATKFRQPIELFNWDSDVRTAFALKKAARWKSLGSEINRCGWMISGHILIDVDSKDWSGCSSVGQITGYLDGIYQGHKTLLAKLSDAKVKKALKGK